MRLSGWVMEKIRQTWSFWSRFKSFRKQTFLDPDLPSLIQIREKKKKKPSILFLLPFDTRPLRNKKKIQRFLFVDQ